MTQETENARVLCFPGAMFCGECGRALSAAWRSWAADWHKKPVPTALMNCTNYQCKMYEKAFDIPAKSLEVQVRDE
jgi:hypothetical protein